MNRGQSPIQKGPCQSFWCIALIVVIGIVVIWTAAPTMRWLFAIRKISHAERHIALFTEGISEINVSMNIHRDFVVFRSDDEIGLRRTKKIPWSRGFLRIEREFGHREYAGIKRGIGIVEVFGQRLPIGHVFETKSNRQFISRRHPEMFDFESNEITVPIRAWFGGIFTVCTSQIDGGISAADIGAERASFLIVGSQPLFASINGRGTSGEKNENQKNKFRNFEFIILAFGGITGLAGIWICMFLAPNRGYNFIIGGIIILVLGWIIVVFHYRVASMILAPGQTSVVALKMSAMKDCIIADAQLR
jgi:hypothetical protein